MVNAGESGVSPRVTETAKNALEGEERAPAIVNGSDEIADTMVLVPAEEDIAGGAEVEGKKVIMKRSHGAYRQFFVLVNLGAWVWLSFGLLPREGRGLALSWYDTSPFTTVDAECTSKT